MSTLKDVAEIAGVSVSTVSYVLSGKKTVRPETLKRIQDAIKQVDYCPNLLASGLKTNLSKTIGVVMWDMQNNYSIEVLRVMEDTICKYGYCMIVCDSDQSPEKERKNLRILLARNIDGLILMAVEITYYPATGMHRYRLSVLIVWLMKRFLPFSQTALQAGRWEQTIFFPKAAGKFCF